MAIMTKIKIGIKGLLQRAEQRLLVLLKKKLELQGVPTKTDLVLLEEQIRAFQAEFNNSANPFPQIYDDIRYLQYQIDQEKIQITQIRDQIVAVSGESNKSSLLQALSGYINQCFQDARYLQNQINVQNEKIDQINCDLSTIDNGLTRLIWQEKYQNPSPEPMNITFLVQKIELWKQWQGLIDKALESPEFRVRFLLIPTCQPGQEKTFSYCWRSREYLEERGYIFEVGDYPGPSHQWIDNSHFVFLQTPYDDQRPTAYRSEFLKKRVKLCYTPYAFTLVDLPFYQYASHFYENCHFFFVESKYHRAYMLEGKPSLKEVIKVTGHPKIEQVASEVTSHGLNSSSYIWNPRWAIEDSFCTIEWSVDGIIQFFDSNRQYELIFRPHPLLLREIMVRGTASLQEKIKNLTTLPNVSVDTESDYTKTFQRGGCLISDASSLLVEFLPYNRPIIFTYNGGNVLNKFGTVVDRCFHHAVNLRQLQDSMALIASGADPLVNERHEALRVINEPGRPAVNILQVLRENSKTQVPFCSDKVLDLF